MTDKPEDKVISIQKFQPKQISEFTKEKMPYTQICNLVLEKCTNTLAGFIWMYLQMKPSTWLPCKWEIMKRFDISEATYKRQMRYLSATGLVEYHQDRNEDGKMGCTRIVVLNGSKFNPNGSDYNGVIFETARDTANYDPHFRKHLRGIKNDTAVEPAEIKGSNRGIKNDTADRNRNRNRRIKKPHSGEMTPHINTRSSSLEKKEKDLSPSPVGEDYLIAFEKFYSVYPRKKDKQDAIKWFKKNKPSPEFVEMLIEDLNKRLATEWSGKEQQYLPYPATYLNGKRWEDEIETAAPVKPKYPTPDERAAVQQKIIEREAKAEAQKKKEIQASKGGVAKLTQKVDFGAMMANYLEDVKRQGITHAEYLENLKKNVDR